MSPLEAARTTLANYDAPRCGATFAHVFTDNSGCGIEAVTRTCRRHAGHPTDGREGHSEFGDRVPGPDHLRAALAEADRLTRTLACERGEWAPEGWVHIFSESRWLNPDGASVWRRWTTESGRHQYVWTWGLWRAGQWVDGTAPTALEAIEACNAAIVGAS